MDMDKTTKNIAVLFARKDSIYKQFLNCDVYDIERDARRYQPGLPIIAHPPCRAWGKLRGLAKPRPDEKELAVWSVWKIRENGGILEHPEGSKLWDELNLPKGSQVDEFGGWTLKIHQSWFGHLAEKKTLLYICGVSPADIPAYPISLDIPQRVITNTKRRNGIRIKAGDPGFRTECTKAQREHTPQALAEWLVLLASKVNVYEQ